MDEQQFFCEVTREIAEFEDANSYLQRVSEEMKLARIEEDYQEYIESILAQDFKGQAEKFDDGFVW
jgi:hypothetical protein